jgi:hypothetical protein
LWRIEKEALSGTGLVEIIPPASIEVLGERWFYECRSLSSITFEFGSILWRIEKEALYHAGLVEIILPASIEILDEECFSKCESVSSISFESGSIEVLGEKTGNWHLSIPKIRLCCLNIDLKTEHVIFSGQNEADLFFLSTAIQMILNPSMSS